MVEITIQPQSVIASLIQAITSMEILSLHKRFVLQPQQTLVSKTLTERLANRSCNVNTNAHNKNMHAIVQNIFVKFGISWKSE
jgi:hypothetical protein